MKERLARAARVKFIPHYILTILSRTRQITSGSRGCPTLESHRLVTFHHLFADSGPDSFHKSFANKPAFVVASNLCVEIFYTKVQKMCLNMDFVIFTSTRLKTTIS